MLINMVTPAEDGAGKSLWIVEGWLDLSVICFNAVVFAAAGQPNVRSATTI